MRAGLPPRRTGVGTPVPVVRRPRARFAAAHPGGPGTDRGALRPLRREPAGLENRSPWVSERPRRDKPMRRTGAAAKRRNRDGNQETRTRDRNRRNGAPGGERVDRKTRLRRKAERLKVRQPALRSPHAFEGKREAPARAGWKTAYPGPVKNAGDGACVDHGRHGRACPGHPRLYDSASYKSLHLGFAALMSRTFHARGQCFIIFSRWIAIRMSS